MIETWHVKHPQAQRETTKKCTENRKSNAQHTNCAHISHEKWFWKI